MGNQQLGLTPSCNAQDCKGGYEEAVIKVKNHAVLADCVRPNEPIRHASGSARRALPEISEECMVCQNEEERSGEYLEEVTYGLDKAMVVRTPEPTPRPHEMRTESSASIIFAKRKKEVEQRKAADGLAGSVVQPCLADDTGKFPGIFVQRKLQQNVQVEAQNKTSAM